ncbi:hypothetical protein L596_029069 [Steinernema carpocapsae]|uniref:Uncharacterized protein n=1 Tax=Steinernema carpocapsae TaxID=34508 RepID=A0A4U5LTJ6_STECR|nr:hypothetical protein L596_029069 [Steinernema carpocapsae]
MHTDINIMCEFRSAIWLLKGVNSKFRHILVCLTTRQICDLMIYFEITTTKPEPIQKYNSLLRPEAIKSPNAAHLPHHIAIAVGRRCRRNNWP